MNKKKLSKSIVALALAGALALTGCNADDDDPNGDNDLGDTTTTSIVDDMTTTTIAP
jgi:PBP1b-binding outer membrane lipoprotein LpoB